MPNSKNTYEYIEHPFEPVWNEKSRILILGTLPSPKSRKYGFYYGHPRNRFWATISQIIGVQEPEEDKNSKEAFLLANNIAVWDVLHSCFIKGASDSSIRDAVPNKFQNIIQKSNISTIFTTGSKATKLFNTLSADKAGMTARYLPSTSPANSWWNKKNYFVLWKNEIEQSLLK